MAAPKIVNVYPYTAHTSGGMMVRVLGGEFRPEPGRVRVLFGETPSERVIVANHALLYALVPKAAPGVTGLVPLTVANLAADGTPTPGETTVHADRFAYRTATLTAESDLLRVVRAFIRLLKREVILNVSIGQTHTDYDADTDDRYNLTEVQSLPALVVTGPELVKVSQPNEQTYGPSLGVQGRFTPPEYFDASFSIVGVAEKWVHLINLQSLLMAFFGRNRELVVERDPAKPHLGVARFSLELDQGGAPSINAGADDSNVKTFAARCVIRLIPINGTIPDVVDSGQDVTEVVTDFACGWLSTYQKL